MKFYSPIMYDKEGNEIAWLVSEIPAETIAQFRWAWAQQVKSCKVSFRTPIIGEDKEED